ncbi:competence type IV pilus major pilin ComGC [Lactobacillaceae bacterium 24-114]
MLKKKHAFTLLEMSIVLFIISLLILIVLPNLTAQRKNAKNIHGNAMVSVIQTQADEYVNDGGKENMSLEDLRQAKYLTSAQVKKAKEQHIVIVDGKVVKR